MVALHTFFSNPPIFKVFCYCSIAIYRGFKRDFLFMENKKVEKIVREIDDYVFFMKQK